ncbi:hypothetical protein COR50_01245 [Chitinophaga caeni]|uniref:Uncharacterized protein n=1 Tax=Chitinophaga caeni TaxID=2029983 RepID=A0A291QPQ0_9BACT|nr:hypothetical protein [Chitinophaga caeni]ATL45895.1 hypothetical protein COR50_01245 [Chitinophaga caeni]
MRIILLGLGLFAAVSTSCSKTNSKHVDLGGGSNPGVDSSAPAATWQEHWFEHKQLVKNVAYTEEVALYYDDDMDRTVTWPLRKAEEIWKYTKKTYAPFKGEDKRLNVILHYGKYGGGHPYGYFDASHDNRTGVDIGSNNSWKDSSGWNLDVITHEIGHIVEGAFKGVKESPAFDIWGDSKWMEIYIYDVYKGLGWDAEAERCYNSTINGSDNFPRPGTQWFKNWFYPIYDQYGGATVLNNFFTLLSEHFPQKKHNYGMEYTRRMNMGEFVHFWSGAANADLKDLAIAAFGTKDRNGGDWTIQLENAKKDFPGITY